MSFENTRSRVQSMATRSFFSNRGNLLRYTVRQIHQARKPENLSPRMLATPVRFPMVASCPMVEKTKGFLGFPRIDAVMFWTRGFAEVPAVQTTVLLPMVVPSLSVTPYLETVLTFVFTWISTPRSANF